MLCRYAYWQVQFLDRVGYLHGQMSGAEKEKVLHQFRQGEISLLVSTTVIEVGIHVPEASTMIIEESQRFGLSQLHQLRGRIGRGGLMGHCFFLYTPPLAPGVQARLAFLRQCHDGFAIAEKDCKKMDLLKIFIPFWARISLQAVRGIYKRWDRHTKTIPL